MPEYVIGFTVVDSAVPASYGYPRQPRMWTDPPAEGCVVLTFDETWGDA